MKIAIIGAGFTGLAAAYRLTRAGHDVQVFEKDSLPGGLAVGYQEPGWEWTLEKHYHHWFTNDTFVLRLAEEIGHPVIIRTPISSFLVNGVSYRFDSPQAMLAFPKLPLFDKIRMAVVFALLFRLNPFWKVLERFSMTATVPHLIGEKAFTMLWKPQLVNKMGKHAEKISLVWFWARIKKRTTSLAYPEGGFLSFAQALTTRIEKQGGVVRYNTEVTRLTDDKAVRLTIRQGDKVETAEFNRVIVTLPSFLFVKIASNLPGPYRQSLVRLEGLSATNLVLRLRKPFLADGTYWMSVCEPDAPVMAIIEHTNFMDKRHYHNEHLVYLGNYAFTDALDWNKQNLLALYDPFLRKINRDYKKSLIGYELFKAPFAQPIVPRNYSKLMPSMVTPLPHVFLANIEQVYPWDRGTNYAVELGEKVAKIVQKL